MILNYGKRIKDLREFHDVSQKELAEAIGITRTAYKNFELQDIIIPIKRLNQIANYFHVSIDYLFGLTDTLSYKTYKEEIDFELASKRMKEFRKLNKLTQEELAKSINGPRSVIVFHELKRTILGTPFLFELCSKYHISADYLLGKIDEKSF